MGESEAKTAAWAAMALAFFCLSGCAPTASQMDKWRGMLARSVMGFTSTLPPSNGRVWIHDMRDSECDRPCRSGAAPAGCTTGTLGPQGASKPSVGLLGAVNSERMETANRLAFQVFIVHLVGARRWKVIEPHRHNYATEIDGGEAPARDKAVSQASKAPELSCSDLCALDDAKKHAADKLLAYEIQSLGDDDMVIHFRYSDTRTGLIEATRILGVEGSTVSDRSPAAAPSQAKAEESGLIRP